MITKIDVCNEATFGSMTPLLDGLKKINFFFGANGTGKTTISRVIADPTQFPSNAITWEKGIALETRVYNRLFCRSELSSTQRRFYSG